MESLTYPVLITVLRDVGFPIAVTGYVLIVLNRSLRELTTAVNALHQLVALQARHARDTPRE